MRITVAVVLMAMVLAGCGSSARDGKTKSDPRAIANEVAGDSGLRPVGPEPGDEGFCGETHKAFEAYTSVVGALNSIDLPARVDAFVATSRSAESAAPSDLTAASTLVFDVARAHADMIEHTKGMDVDESVTAAFVAVADNPAFDESVARLAAAIDDQCTTSDHVVEDALDTLEAEVDIEVGSYHRAEHPPTS